MENQNEKVVGTETNEASSQNEIDDGPTLNQAAWAACNEVIEELDRASAKYNDVFESSSEALGAIRGEYLEVEELLGKVKINKGKYLDMQSPLLAKDLQGELFQLAAMAIKAALSFTDMIAICDKVSEKIRQNTAISEAMANICAEQTVTDEQEHA